MATHSRQFNSVDVSALGIISRGDGFYAIFAVSAVSKEGEKNISCGAYSLPLHNYWLLDWSRGGIRPLYSRGMNAKSVTVRDIILAIF